MRYVLYFVQFVPLCFIGNYNFSQKKILVTSKVATWLQNVMYNLTYGILSMVFMIGRAKILISIRNTGSKSSTRRKLLLMQQSNEFTNDVLAVVYEEYMTHFYTKYPAYVLLQILVYKKIYMIFTNTTCYMRDLAKLLINSLWI